ncbi:hypothetical protein HF576_01175 [Microbacterium sp. CFH 90308]|uniref:Lipoprotein n=1 Tax=Microbacterium salsuginis TaxID=2722803 RepID=A0ABX1K619_9MICO|nr:DUF6624 domain-containing protein [Microbacterium sp. CFH 90308]NLP82453.1 hypothetical protein [Microbacterium sp. CFH 90308]
MSRRALVIVVTLLAGILVGCAGPAGTAGPAVNATAPSTPAPTITEIRHETADAIDTALRDELLAMLAQDQADRLSGDGGAGGSGGTDQERTERLAEILAEHGWPSYSLVGEEAEDAAWAIAQHSDHDPEFQRLALRHLRAAVEAGDASPGNLAYLTDRIAVGAGRPQEYGTQIGCGEDGPAPATPIRDEAGVDARRAEVGLAPLADYYAELEAICSEEEQ